MHAGPAVRGRFISSLSLLLLTGVASLFSSAAGAPHPEVFRHLDAARHPRLTALVSQATPTPTAPDLFDRVVAGVLHGVLS